MAELDEWLPELTPPPGGLASLRTRLARRPPSPAWRALPALAAALALLLLLPGRSPPGLRLDDPALVAPPEAPVSVRPGAEERLVLERVPNPAVVWYRVAGTTVVAHDP